jgi:hypothetical protein
LILIYRSIIYMKASKIKVKKRLYRNIGLTLLLFFAFYICYKTYQTQQKKNYYREGFKKPESGGDDDDEKAPQKPRTPGETKDVYQQAISACTGICFTDEGSCDSYCDSANEGDEDEAKKCKKKSGEGGACKKNIKKCQKYCDKVAKMKVPVPK